MSKPGDLTLGVAPRRPLPGGNCGVERQLAAQVPHKLGKAYRLHRRQIRVEAAGRERGGLLQRSGIDHRREPCVAGRIKRFPRRHQQDHGKAIGRLRMTSLAPHADRHTRRAHDLIGADQP